MRRAAPTPGWLLRARAPLAYAALCAALMLGLRERAWQHVATLNGAEWRPVAQVVREARQEGEPVCFVPGWTRGHAVDLYKFRGIEVLRAPAAAWRGRSAPVPGLWVISQFGAFDPDSVPARRFPLRDRRRLGQAEIYLFRGPGRGGGLPDSLAFHLHEATCALAAPGQAPVTLQWQRTGFSLPRSCPWAPEDDHQGCRVAQARSGGEERTGVRVHPPPDGQQLVITWPRREVRPWLVISGGLVDGAAGEPGASVELRVALDGRTLDTLTFRDPPGWQTRRVPTGGVRGLAALSVRVRAARAGGRGLIFDGSFAGRSTAAPRAGAPPAAP